MTQESRPHYVSNKKLFTIYQEHLEEVQKADELGKPRPSMPPYIAEAIMKIAKKYGNKPNFIGYSYRDEMIGDAIEICCKNYLKFNPQKSENPFAYLTQFCHNAFLQRIAKEKKQTSVKAKYITQAVDTDMISSQAHDDDEFHNQFVEFLRENSVFEDSIAAKKAKKTKKDIPSVEDFMIENEDDLDNE